MDRWQHVRPPVCISGRSMSPAELAALEAVLIAHGEVIPAIAIPARG